MLKMRLKWQLCKSSKWKPLAWSIWGPTIRSCCQLPRHPSVALSYLKRLYQMHLRAAVVIKIPPNLAHFEPKRHSAAICWYQMISFKKKSCLCSFYSFCNKYFHFIAKKYFIIEIHQLVYIQKYILTTFSFAWKPSPSSLLFDIIWTMYWISSIIFIIKELGPNLIKSMPRTAHMPDFIYLLQQHFRNPQLVLL